MSASIDHAVWTAALRAPLEVPRRLIYRPWTGGDLTRRFRGTPSSGNDHWTEEWIGADMDASNPRPDGQAQGLTVVRASGGQEARLKDLAEHFPDAMLGSDHVRRHGTRIGFLMKLISLSSTAPVHAHPDATFASRYLHHDQDQSETWVILQTKGQDEGHLPVGIGFRDGVARSDVTAAVAGRSTLGLRELLEPTTIEAGDTLFVRSGVPHYISSEVLFIEVQQPSDFTILTEYWTLGASEDDATLGLGWDRALDAFAFGEPEHTGKRAVERARQHPTTLREEGRSREVGLIEPHPRMPFDMRRLEVEDGLVVDDARFSIVVVTDGDGTIEGEWGGRAISKGDIFALPASVPLRIVAGSQPLHVHRCLGPTVG